MGPPLHEVRHGRLCVRGGGRRPPGRGHQQRRVHRVGGVLVLERRRAHHRRVQPPQGRGAGCIAESALFRQKREWFRKIFPLFMKYVTGGYVSEEEAGWAEDQEHGLSSALGCGVTKPTIL